ncbi:MAG: cytochrome P450 [Gammaproteobacteria bacterium]
MCIKTIPQVKGDFLIGNFRQIKTSPFHAYCRWQHEYGDLVGFKIAAQQFYLMSHPKFIEQALIKQNEVFTKLYEPEKAKGLALVLGQGLVTSQGALWQRQRRLMQPVFQRSNLGSLMPQITRVGQGLLDRWKNMGDRAEVNLSDEMTRLTLEVITQTMFGISVLDKIEQIAPALDTALRFSAKSVLNPIAIPLFIPTKSNQAFKRAMAVLDDVIYAIIDDRRENGGDEQDLLTMLLKARDPDTGGKMNNRQLRDEVITIFSAGHETTSNLLSWTLYLLARHPDTMAKLRTEFDSLPSGKVNDIGDLQQLVYTKAVLNESMRIRPPVGMMIRKVSKDTEIDGYQMKAGSLAIFSIYNIHHHAEFWPNADQFDPARFLHDENRRFCFMPFGTGERVCIGNHFAMLESQILLNMIVQRFEIELSNEDEPEIDMAVSLRPKGGIPVTIKPRT